MKTWNILLILLLTLGMLAAGAFLPQIVAAVQDSRPQEGHAPVQGVELELRVDYLSVMDRIAILSNTNAVEIPEEMASRSLDEILDLAAEIVAQYQNAGLITAPDIDVHSQLMGYSVWLSVFQGDTTVSSIHWNLQILFDEEEAPLLMSINDETGALLRITYDYSKESYFDPDISMEVLSTLYLAGLGEDFSEYSPAGLEVYTDNGKIIGQNWAAFWEDEVYGSYGVSFDTRQYGFSVSPC